MSAVEKLVDKNLTNYTITDSLKKDDPVVLVGFGTFATKDRAARTGRNPQTGAPIEIKAAKVPSLSLIHI